jgi:hypothetical protein
MMIGMGTRPVRRGHKGAGRPSKGARELFATRLPAAEAEQFRLLADTLGVSYSDLLLELSRIGMAHRAELPFSVQEELNQTA